MLPAPLCPPPPLQVAAGGLRINATMGANVGPQVYVFNFTTAGIQINGGHETMVRGIWWVVLRMGGGPGGGGSSTLVP